MTNTIAPGFGKLWVTGILNSFRDATESLGDLDRRAGDGDFGTNIATAMRLTQGNVDSSSPGTYREWVTCVYRGFLGVGGTSGPLFGMFFRDLARAADAEPTVAEFAEGLAAGLATVQRYGGAEVGHKTMVDAVDPAVRALQGALASHDDAPLTAAAAAAVEGARSTAGIVARRGRASYVGEVARGVLDPGACAAAIMLQAAAAAAQGSDGPADTSWIDTP